MFNFFLKSYRCGLLDFCGSVVNVQHDISSDNGKIAFKLYDNGIMKLHNLKSRHSNILKGVIIGKKSWGLHVKMWSDGISECNFTLSEILYDFEIRNIKIPESLLTDLKNNINKKK
jgi:hypothetical protein